jgi:DNA-binding transcriptional regulator YdaS (Cro superfamily)
MNKKNPVARAVEILGGPVSAARLLGVRRYQNVQQWVARGFVPAKYAPPIERLTNFEVRCEHISRDVDWEWVRKSGLNGIN